VASPSQGPGLLAEQQGQAKVSTAYPLIHSLQREADSTYIFLDPTDMSPTSASCASSGSCSSTCGSSTSTFCPIRSSSSGNKRRVSTYAYAPATRSLWYYLSKHLCLQSELQGFQSELARLNAHGMRSLASKYLATLFQSIHRIVHGSSEAITSISGQTLLEETQAQGTRRRANADSLDFLTFHSREHRVDRQVRKSS
jgi:hypothetical protein